jgi:proteasome lid subunit RPN8/RPN11
VNVIIACELPHWWLDSPWHERCASLIGTYDSHFIVITDVIPINNLHKNPRHHFMVQAKNVPGFIGVVHSHPHNNSPEPSQDDIDQIADGLLGAVYYKSGMIFYTHSKGRLPGWRSALAG